MPSPAPATPSPAPAIPLLRWERRTAITGLVATAVAFGPGRMAYGMLLPPIRAEFGLSASAAGLVASAAFAAFAVALVLAAWATRRLGAKAPIVAGGALAALGGAAAAVAQEAALLAVGVALAAASAGLCWTPFNAVAGRIVRPRRQAGVLSLVSTGSALGIGAMAAGALLMAWTPVTWRAIFAATALGGAGAAGLAFAWLPPSRRLVPRNRPDAPPLRPATLLDSLATREAAPLHLAAGAFGAVSAAMSTFAVDHVAAGGGLAPAVAGGTVYAAYAAFGLAGFAAGAFERRVGLADAMAACFLALGAGTGLLAAWPGALGAAALGAGLGGAGVMVFSVLLAVAAMRQHPDLPVVGFSAVVVTTSAGSVVGAAAAGGIADLGGAGTGEALAAAALVGLLAALAPALLPRRVRAAA